MTTMTDAIFPAQHIFDFVTYLNIIILKQNTVHICQNNIQIFNLILILEFFSSRLLDLVCSYFSLFLFIDLKTLGHIFLSKTLSFSRDLVKSRPSH